MRTPRWLRKATAQAPWTDGVIAAGVAIWTVIDATTSRQIAGAAALNALAFGIAGLTLAARRGRPVAIAAIVWAASAGQALATGDATQATSVFVLLVVTNYAAGRWATGRSNWVGLAVIVAGLTIHELSYRAYNDISGMIVGQIFILAPWVVGRYVLQRHRVTASLSGRVALAEQDRQAAEAVAAATERTRIAREMHDVISHGVSVMGIQAGAAERMMAEDPTGAMEALRSIQGTARTTLSELQRMLVVLRGDAADNPLGPLPRLVDAERLITDLISAGVAASFSFEGNRRPVLPGVELAAYRIIQEGLTNATRHAPGAAIDVRVRFASTALEVSVTDEGSGARLGGAGSADGSGPDRGGAAPGHGLAGLRERIAVHGGTFTSGKVAGGGFRIHATLPLEQRV